MNKQEILNRINRAEKELEEAKELLKSLKELKVGQIYRDFTDDPNVLYVVARIPLASECFYALVCIESGECYVSLREKIDDIFDGDRADFELVE